MSASRNVETPQQAQLLRRYPSMVSEEKIQSYWRQFERLRNPRLRKWQERIRLPGDVCVAGQACYAAIDAESMKRDGVHRLETAGLGTCVALAFVDIKEPACLLAHVDAERENSLDQVLEGRTNDFDRAYVIYGDSYESDSRNHKSAVRAKVTQFAIVHAPLVEFRRHRSGSVGVKLDGTVYEPHKLVKPKGRRPYMTRAYLNIQWLPDSEEEVRRVLSLDPNFRRMKNISNH